MAAYRRVYDSHHLQADCRERSGTLRSVIQYGLPLLLVKKLFVKLFNIGVVKSCRSYFGLCLPSESWAKGVTRFDAKYVACGRTFVHYGYSML